MRINKITLLASLFVSGITIAQEFYTCVPKKDWWRKAVNEWKLVSKMFLSTQYIKDTLVCYNVENLDAGNYKFKLVKKSKVIAQKNVELSREQVLNFCKFRFVCIEGVSGMSGHPYSLEKTVFLRDEKIEKFDFPCDGYAESYNNIYFVLDGNVLFISSYTNGSIEKAFEPFKDATLKIYKKVED